MITKFLKLVVIIMLACSGTATSQETVRIYTVRYKGEDVGTMKLQQVTNGDTVHYKMTSDIKTRFVFKITVQSVEESTFQHGRLISSTVNRKVNGNEKVKRLTKASDKTYTITKEGETGLLHNNNISYNLMRLYCLEPVNINKVYSDNYQQFLPITKIRQNTYKVVLPDGNYNYYSYKNGICSKVEVFSSLYNLEMILR